MSHNLTIIKMGGKDLFETNSVYDDIARLAECGERIILVVGGSRAIELEHQQRNTEITWLTLPNGDKIRFCGTEEMRTIEAAYRNIVFPHVSKKLSERGLSSVSLCGADNRIVTGKRYPPLKVRSNDGCRIERNSLVGEISGIDSYTLKGLLEHLSVVVLAPPIAAEKNEFINVDADMLAAHLAVQMNAAYLHFMTSTNGILENIDDSSSTIQNIDAGNNTECKSVRGRMRQKLRAAIHSASKGTAFVTISSSRNARPITDMMHSETTHVWKFDASDAKRRLFTRMVQISSVSRFEGRIAQYLAHELKCQGFQTEIDQAGNLIARIGRGKKKLMLLGHIDTVPGAVALYSTDDCLSGRGSVDAKGPLAAFFEAASHFKDSKDIEITVIGAVEEENSSAKGGLHVRDNYGADAVIIGEPSDTTGIVLGYNGLVKIKITTAQDNAHSASRGYISSPDVILNTIHELKHRFVNNKMQDVSLRELNSWHENGRECSMAVLNIRISPECRFEDMITFIEEYRRNNPSIQLDILRMSPGIMNSKTTSIANSLYRAIREHGKEPRFLFKSGTSDMNTLASKWRCPMAAYGPGDGKLDHTPNEHVSLLDFDMSCRILKQAISNWADANRKDIV